MYLLATSRSSDIISLLLSPILFFPVLSSFLSTRVILDACTPLSPIRGLTVLQNFHCLKIFNSLFE